MCPTSLIKLRFKGFRCDSEILLFKWKVTWYYAYIPFKHYIMFIKLHCTFGVGKPTLQAEALEGGSSILPCSTLNPDNTTRMNMWRITMDPAYPTLPSVFRSTQSWAHWVKVYSIMDLLTVIFFFNIITVDERSDLDLGCITLDTNLYITRNSNICFGLYRFHVYWMTSHTESF